MITPAENINLYGELIFPDSVPIFNKSNESHSVKELLFRDKETVVFILSKNCKYSISSLPEINNIVNQFTKTNKYEFMVIWTDKIPWKEMNKQNLQYIPHYSLKGKTKLFQVVPSVVMLTDNAEITLRSTASYDPVILRILEQMKGGDNDARFNEEI